MPSPLQLYQSLLGKSQALEPQFKAAADEERSGYDAGMGEINSAYSQDQGGPLRAMAVGMLKGKPGFAGEFGSGLEGYNTANDRERAIQRERAGKIAALQAARAKVSNDMLSNESNLISQQSGLTSGMQNTISSDRNYGLASRQQALEEADRKRWDDVVKQLGTANAIPGMSPGERMAIGAAGYKNGPQLLNTIIGRDQKSASQFGKMAEDMGFSRGTPEYNEIVLRLQRGEDLRPPQAVTAEKQQLAQGLGIPDPTIDPFQNLSPANRQKAELSYRTRADKRLEQANAAAQTALGENAQLDRFGAINQRDQRTGYGWSWTPNITSDAQEMAGISANLSRSQRQAGEGTISDFDARQFQKMVPSTANSPEANSRMIEARKAANQMAVQKNAFLNDYYRAYGHLESADSAWQRYAEANPIFDRANPDKLNKSRRSYQDFFNLERGKQAYKRPEQPAEGPAGQGGSPVIRYDENGNRVQ